MCRLKEKQAAVEKEGWGTAILQPPLPSHCNAPHRYSLARAAAVWKGHWRQASVTAVATAVATAEDCPPWDCALACAGNGAGAAEQQALAGRWAT